ncbi:MAG TPA: hypothetical protein VNA28_04530 [Solirubrobacteraceae bacterium]|nr:hypothetical protein [Solirubrobacteraceae bacterium]
MSATLAALVAASSLAACTEVKKEAAEGYSPVEKLSYNKKGDVTAVELKQEGADRISLRTGTVQGDHGHATIPYAALLYHADGGAYVYTNPKGLTYVPTHIEIGRVLNDRVELKHGPPAGTKVVTQGAQEVHGAELEYGAY